MASNRGVINGENPADEPVHDKCRGLLISGPTMLWMCIQRGFCRPTATRQAIKPGGWKTMPFIIGNEVCDKLATIGLSLGMILYLTQEFHFDLVFAANILSITNGTAYITPVIGGYLADSYLGRFWTLIIASVFNLLGMGFMVITAAVGSLRPTPCPINENQTPSQCSQASAGQLSVLYLAFTFLAVASGGIKPCAYPFGADQFNQETSKGKAAFQSYSNWYFFGIYFSVILSATIVVYVQQSVSWTLGFGIPTILMGISIAIYVLGIPFYKYEVPAGSILKDLIKVCNAAFHKRSLKISENPETLFDPPLGHVQMGEKILHTDHFSFLDKAAVLTEGDVAADGSILRPWRICTVHQVEQLKLVLRTCPIMIATMLHVMVVSQQASFVVLQANTMQRHAFGSFKVPAASMTIFGMLAIIICLPIYDKLILPFARRVTETEMGITYLQRIGMGHVMQITAMVLSGIVEGQRRRIARERGLVDKPGEVVPMSVFWLVPQLSIMGLGEAFNGVGVTEFFYDQVPEGMRSTVGSINSGISGVGVYISAMILTGLQKLSRRGGNGEGWLENNLNRGHLDRFYYFIAAQIGITLMYFLLCSTWYTYKAVATAPTGEDPYQIQLNVMEEPITQPQN